MNRFLRGLLPSIVLVLGAIAATSAESPEVLLEASRDRSERPGYSNSGRSTERSEMVRRQVARRGVADAVALEAMRRVPRHLFVPERSQALAYADSPLPIGHGQTISQPFIVGYMTQMLALEPSDKVLEVGTGSGYQAAILAEIVDHVVSVEIIAELARSAAERMRALGYGNITVLHGDGYFGWPEAGPYDAIIVTAAAEHVPPPLLAQLKAGGRMAIPVGGSAWTQNLLLLEKREDEQVTTRNLMPVRFVPLTGER